MSCGYIGELVKSNEIGIVKNHPYTNLFLNSVFTLDTNKEIVIPELKIFHSFHKIACHNLS